MLCVSCALGQPDPQTQSCLAIGGTGLQNGQCSFPDGFSCPYAEILNGQCQLRLHNHTLGSCVLDPCACSCDWSSHIDPTPPLYCDSHICDVYGFKGCEIINGQCTTIYSRTNEYADSASASVASCAPGSMRVNCSSLNACVDCGGRCYSSDFTYNSSMGDMSCVGGHWVLGTPEGFRSGLGSCVLDRCACSCDWASRINYAGGLCGRSCFEIKECVIINGQCTTIYSKG